MIEKALEEAVRKAGPPTRFNLEEHRQAIKRISLAIIVGDLMVLAALLAFKVEIIIIAVVGAILAVDSLVGIPLIASLITKTITHYLRMVAELRPNTWCITGSFIPALTMSFGDCIVHVKRNTVVFGRASSSTPPYRVLSDRFVLGLSIVLTALYCTVLVAGALTGYGKLESLLALSTLLYFLALCVLGFAYYRTLRRSSIAVEIPNPIAPQERIVIVGRALYSLKSQPLTIRAITEAIASCTESVRSSSLH